MPQTFAPLNTTREERGKAITEKKGQIWRYGNGLYRVMSQSGHGSYQVKKTDFGWKCTCPDHQIRSVECKHIIAVKLSFALREEVRANVTLDPVILKLAPPAERQTSRSLGLGTTRTPTFGGTSALTVASSSALTSALRK